MVKSIAVLGAGHGGCAAAADLTARGFEVRLHARREETLSPLKKQGGVKATGVQDGLFPARLLTTDVEAAVSGAEIIMLSGAISGAWFLRPSAGAAPNTRYSNFFKPRPYRRRFAFRA